MVCSQAPPVYGGAGTQALGLARVMVRNGLRVDLLTQNQRRCARREVTDGVRIMRAPGEALFARLPRRIGEVARTVTFMAWLFLLLMRGRYDVIHLHGSYWFGLPAVLVARLRAQASRCESHPPGRGRRSHCRLEALRPHTIGRLYGSTFREAAVTIALSEEIARRHRESFSPSRPVILQPNGVDVARFQAGLSERSRVRQELGLTDDAFVALFVGYLAPHKGVGVLLDAWKTWEPDRNRQLLLVGPSSGFYRELEDTMSARARGDARCQGSPPLGL